MSKTSSGIGFCSGDLRFCSFLLHARNDCWHFPDEDDDASKQNEVPHNQHSDACSFENAIARTFQFHGTPLLFLRLIGCFFMLWRLTSHYTDSR